jgi:hypothetical protein
MLKPIALFALVALSGCFAYLPMEYKEHLNVQWRSSYQQAQADAQRLNRPILVVMIAGDKEGAICMGGHYLRSLALRDERVIARINEEFVPVWINIRTTPVPPFPFVKDVLVTATIDRDYRVTDVFSRNYFIRSVIASPDGQRLLNSGAPTVSATAKNLLLEGDWGYEAMDPGDYLSMLQRALRTFHGGRGDRV